MPVPQQIVGNLPYNVQNVDIGSGYAAGITQAGKSISGAITGVLGGMNEKGEPVQGILEQSQTSKDMLATLNTMKNPDGSAVLPQDQYEAAVGKSLGAQQALIGLYTNKWIADQAAARQLSLEQGKGGVDVATAHAKLLDTYQMIKTGGSAGAAATGVKPGQVALDGGSSTSATQPPNQPAQPGQPAPQLGPPGHPQIPAGAKFGTMTNPQTKEVVRGWQMPDGSFLKM
jgi:hypothetical protein